MVTSQKASGRGYIDRTGRLVIQVSYRYARQFSEGLAAVRVDSVGQWHWGYIDQRGRVAIPLRSVYWAYDFSGGLAQVWFALDGQGIEKWGYVDQHGRVCGDTFLLRHTGPHRRPPDH
jgi:hypothetical protein